MTASLGDNALGDLLTEGRIARQLVVSVTRWTAGLVLLVMTGTGTGVLLLILLPIIWTQALLGPEPSSDGEEMSWVE